MLRELMQYRPDSQERRQRPFKPSCTMSYWDVRALKWLYPSLGAISCAGTAALLCIFFRNSSFNTALPVCFLAIILSVAGRFGVLAGILGTIFAEAIFAFFMFAPLHSLAVQSQAARNSLLWMFLGGLALSELFSHHPPDPGKPNVHRRV